MTEFSRRTFVTSVMGALGAVGVAAAVPTSALATETRAGTPYDAFLRATGVVGDSTDVNYREWIYVDSWSWGTLGKDADPLTLTTQPGRHSATLLGKAFTSSVIDEIGLVVRKVGAQSSEVITLTLKNAIVAQAMSETGSRATVETWSIPSYSKAELRMRSINSRGQLGAWETAIWQAN